MKSAFGVGASDNKSRDKSQFKKRKRGSKTAGTSSENGALSETYKNNKKGSKGKKSKKSKSSSNE